MKPFRGGLPAVLTRQKFGTLELNYDPTPNLSLTSVTGYYNVRTWVDLNCNNSGRAASGCMTSKRLTARITPRNSALLRFQRAVQFHSRRLLSGRQITNDLDLPGNTALSVLPPSSLFAGTMNRHRDDLVLRPGPLQGDPELEIAAGVRWTHEKRTSSPTSVDLFGAFPVPGSSCRFAAEHPPVRSKNWSPEFTITRADREPDHLRLLQAGLQIGFLQYHPLLHRQAGPIASATRRSRASSPDLRAVWPTGSSTSTSPAIGTRSGSAGPGQPAARAFRS